VSESESERERERERERGEGRGEGREERDLSQLAISIESTASLSFIRRISPFYAPPSTY